MHLTFYCETVVMVNINHKYLHGNKKINKTFMSLVGTYIKCIYYDIIYYLYRLTFNSFEHKHFSMSTLFSRYRIVNPPWFFSVFLLDPLPPSMLQPVRKSRYLVTFVTRINSSFFNINS